MARIDYVEQLDGLWRQHLEPRSIDAPVCVSLFAGCGGSSLGYRAAGFRESLAVEWNQNAARNFKLNFPDVPVYLGDIAKLSIEETMELTGLRSGQLDLLDGSPPCQGFSTAGKRSFGDDRNQLFRQYCRLLQGLMPKTLVMENVSGMVKGKMKLIFADIIRSLKQIGYRVQARLMNTMCFGVPQHRQRIIFVGVRNDLDIEPSHPMAEQRPFAVRDALPELIGTRSMRINPGIDPHRSAATICRTDSDYQGKFNPRRFGDHMVDIDQSIVCNDTGDRFFVQNQDLEEAEIRDTWQSSRVLQGKEPKKHFGLQRIDPARPSPSLIKDAGNTSTGLCHQTEIRKLTIPEIKRLHSYPDQFRLEGSFREKWACVGNSVPPLFMMAIARHIRINILNKINIISSELSIA